MRTLGRGSGFLVGQVRRDDRERSIFRDRQVLGMSPEGAFDVAEDPVAGREGGHAAPDCLDLSGELGPEDGSLRRPRQARPEAQDELPRAAVGAVGPIDRRGVHLDQQLVVAGRGLVDFGDVHHVRRTVCVEDRCSHRAPRRLLDRPAPSDSTAARAQAGVVPHADERRCTCT